MDFPVSYRDLVCLFAKVLIIEIYVVRNVTKVNEAVGESLITIFFTCHLILSNNSFHSIWDAIEDTHEQAENMKLR